MENYDVIDNSILILNGFIESSNDSAYANVADTYLPIGPNNRDNIIDWSRVYQEIIGLLYGLSLNARSIDQLREEVLEVFSSSRDTRELVNVIDELYFSSNELRAITPLAYLVTNNEKITARTKTMISIIGGLITKPSSKEYSFKGCNPLERSIISNIYQLCEEKEISRLHGAYLPFLSEVFSSDLNTLADNHSYFLSEIENFTSLYTFIYLTQLTIQLCIPANRYNIPSSKKLYFILETEVASKERHECNQFGYEYIFSKTKGLAYNVFPALGYFNRVTKNPIWGVNENDPDKFLDKVNKFNNSLAMLFGEKYYPEDSLFKAFNKGVSFHQQIFDETLKSSKKGSRKVRNYTVVNVFESTLSAGFITNRRGAGKYFVLKSNIIMLLTNMIISGSSCDKMLIDDLIDGFNNRGIWLDVKSKKALLRFYETVGNIEKLSDSGDAVYVKSTI